MNKLTGAFLSVVFFIALPCGLQAGPGEDLFMKNCRACHGADGKGQTPMGKRLNIKDYTKAEVQDAMTDEHIAKVIREGIVDESGKKVMLPFDKKMSDEEIASVVAYLRTLRQ